MTRERRKIHYLGPIVLTTALTAVVAGCATVPPPIAQMDRAQSEIRAARNAGAATAAPDALAAAERRLAAARQFSTDNDNGKATDKAAEAEAAAATARTRARLAQLDREVAQQAQVNAALHADLQRRQAAAAAAQQAALAPAPGSPGVPAAPTSTRAPVVLPSIELGPPATPASGSTSGGAGPGVHP